MKTPIFAGPLFTGSFFEGSMSEHTDQKTGRPQRILSSLASALVITAALLVLMEQLVHVDLVLPPETTIHRIDTAVFEPPKEIERLPPVKPPAPEPAPRMELAQSPIDLGPTDFTFGGMPQPTPERVDKGNMGVMDSGAIPIVRIAPDYPPRAVTRGIEGYVDLSFDIAASGQPVNIAVIGGEPEGIFDSAAVRALKRWKYRPKLEGGEAVVQFGQTTRIRFELNK